MAKQLMYSDEARKQILNGVRKLADAVRITMGPTGRNVILEQSYGSPTVSKDGVTVAKEVELEGKFENMGAKMVNEVADKTSDVAGDGTTTATVLAERIYSRGLKAITSGANPMEVKRGIDEAARAVVRDLKKRTTPVSKKEEIAQVGTISANNDSHIGNLLADAVDKVGKDGVITVEEGNTLETTLELEEGMQFDKGYISHYFITDQERREAVLEDARVLLFEEKISNLRDFVPLLEKVAQQGDPLLIVAEDMEGEALAATVVNKLRGVLDCCAVKAPGFGKRRKAMMEDLAVLSGGRFISEDLGVELENVEISDLGTADRIVVTEDDTTIVGGGGDQDDIQARIERIRTQIEKSDSDYDREKLQERLGKLTGGVAVVRVGAASESEMGEKKARVEDALHSTRAAVDEGILPGGGTALLRAKKAVEKRRKNITGDQKIGADIVKDALEAPIRTIAKNTGQNGAVVASEVLSQDDENVGFDARTGEYVDMLEAGIVDPTKVTRTAVENAASLGGLMLTTETLVTDIDDEEEEEEEGPEGSVR